MTAAATALRSRLERVRRARFATWIAWAAVALWALWALMRLFGLERGYPWVPLIAFTPYVAAASLVPIALAVVLRRRAAAAAAVAVSLLFALIVLPRAVGGGGAEVGDGVPLRVLTANVSFGDADPRALADLAAELDADVLSVQELTPRFQTGLRAALGDRLEHQLVITGAGANGGGIYAELPLKPAPGPTTLPGGFTLPRAELRAAGVAAPVELVNVHALPPTSWGQDDWDDDLRALPRAEERTLRVLAGDFNATLDHAELRELIASGYTDAADAAGSGLTATWPEGRRLPPTVAIDHVLADERIGVGEVSIHELAGSDHRAVFAELELPR